MSDRHAAPEPLPHEVITLGPNRWIELREPTLDDVDDLVLLYDRLSRHDVYRRFFSVTRPDERLLRTWIERVPARGRRLIARREDGTLVADAGYVRQGNGDAELDLVVDPAARGWLGGYLLERLVAAARVDGIRNLEAEVLVENGPMLAVLHHRRYANLGHDDHTIARLVIAVSAETPVWPAEHDQPRILIEGGGLGWIPQGLSTSLGVRVLQCPGPDRPGHCPVLEGRSCPLVAGADAVVTALDTDRHGDELVSAHHRDRPDLRLFVTTGEHPDADVLPGDRPPLEVVACALGLPTTLPRRKQPGAGNDPNPTDQGVMP